MFASTKIHFSTTADAHWFRSNLCLLRLWPLFASLKNYLFAQTLIRLAKDFHSIRLGLLLSSLKTRIRFAQDFHSLCSRHLLVLAEDLYSLRSKPIFAQDCQSGSPSVVRPGHPPSTTDLYSPRSRPLFALLGTFIRFTQDFYSLRLRLFFASLKTLVVSLKTFTLFS